MNVCNVCRLPLHNGLLIMGFRHKLRLHSISMSCALARRQRNNAPSKNDFIHRWSAFFTYLVNPVDGHLLNRSIV